MPDSNSSSPSSRQADISCHSCRKRKVKWWVHVEEQEKSEIADRTYPNCLVCSQTSQTCTYPAGPLKPGPKIGSFRRRKRPRHDGRFDAEDDDGSKAPSWLGTRHATDSHADAAPAPDSEVEEAEVVLEEHDSRDVSSTGEPKTPDLSFILHPAHEPSPPESNRNLVPAPEAVLSDIHAEDTRHQAYALLQMDRGEVERLIAVYFDNMVAVNLFHEPSFPTKLASIPCPTMAAGLLAAMFSFSARFSAQENEPQAETNRHAAHFLNLALRYIDDALRECGDRTPPLCLLQASILTAHCQLSQGVLGRAWRSLGTCVRLAYEMNLHLVDASFSNKGTGIFDEEASRWSPNEEKRRAWWAVWEMDVFATTIRRTPPAIDWTQMEVLLPVKDEDWFVRKPRPSCFFQRDPTRRWKALEATGNQSPKAWFIVINSLMKEAQRISSPRGIPGSRARLRSRSSKADQVDESRQRLEVIANAVRCFQLALPSHLKYKYHQFLGFEARVAGEITSKRQAHCSIYNIHVMTQLARLMIYRYDVFKGQIRVAIASSNSRQDNNDETAPEGEHPTTKEYFDAADEVLAVVHRSSDDHVRYINPFLSSAIWLASAVNLMRSQLCPPGGTLRSVLRSRYEVLHLTYKKCVVFWEMNTAVQQSLETLEEQVETWQQHEQVETRAARSLQQRGGLCEGTQSTGAGKHHDRDERRPVKKRKDTPLPASAAHEDHRTYMHPFPTPPPANCRVSTSDWQTQPQSIEDALNAPGMLDLNSPIETQQQMAHGQLPSSATLIDPMILFGSNPPLEQLFNPSGMGFSPEIDWGSGWDWERTGLNSLQDMF
ncbi:fungal-specific transcription factor domain-containing protein [Aspergillus alliaceus]|uniref:Fungal-specific transcription factor domain-containing protein n=1 Tax=Petromyces alliaceus TaxID=209559 RepID=A0A5N7C037_PETAA|nr:fungal-specific transcription factor domain-containing protein [Aspergillus alliaceus]